MFNLYITVELIKMFIDMITCTISYYPNELWFALNTETITLDFILLNKCIYSSNNFNIDMKFIS